MLQCTCIGCPQLLSKKLRSDMQFHKGSRCTFPRPFYNHLIQADRTKYNNKYKGDSIPIKDQLLPLGIGFCPLSVDPFGAVGPAASFLLFGSPNPNIRSDDWKDAVSGERIPLYSAKDYKIMEWKSDFNGKPSPLYFPAELADQLKAANKHAFALANAGKDVSSFAASHITPFQSEIRALYSVIARGTGNSLILYESASSFSMAKDNKDFKEIYNHNPYQDALALQPKDKGFTLPSCSEDTDAVNDNLVDCENLASLSSSIVDKQFPSLQHSPSSLSLSNIESDSQLLVDDTSSSQSLLTSSLVALSSPTLGSREARGSQQSLINLHLQNDEFRNSSTSTLNHSFSSINH